LLFGIDGDTKHNIRLFEPLLHVKLEGIIERFYAHLISFPEARKILERQKIKDHLQPAQEKHWMRLFSCDFDEEYVSSAVRVGRRHYESKVAPYLYIGGYNFFHCELIRTASEHYGRSSDLPNILTAITRVVSLDMDLALFAYTREYWRRGA
jgi:hemoglobin-like flavoprotein